MIVQLEEAKRELIAMRPDIEDLGHALRVDALAAKVEELEQMTLAPDFWNNAANSSKVLQTIKQSKETVDGYHDLVQRLEDTLALCEMSIEEDDESSLEEIRAELEAIREEAEHKRIEVLMCGEYDNSTAIVSFHPGAGGTEAQDWCQMLYRMITRWAEQSGFKVKLLDWLDGDAAGIKSATIMVEGAHAYGYLKSEHGVHRLVRVSPFDAAGRRQTSFASIEVMPEFPDLDEVELKEDEYEFMAYHSSGAGGQNVNKACPTGTRIVSPATCRLISSFLIFILLSSHHRFPAGAGFFPLFSRTYSWESRGNDRFPSCTPPHTRRKHSACHSWRRPRASG